MSYLLDESDFDITNLKITNELISNIESKIQGKIPEITRLYDHIKMIFNMITANRKRLGYRLYQRISIELEQLQSIFDYDPSILKDIILRKDIKQYNIFYKNIISRKNNIDKLNIYLTRYIRIIKSDYIKVIEQLYITKSSIKNRNEYYIANFRTINSIINSVRSYKHDIPFIIKPCQTIARLKHKDYLCAAKSVYGLGQEEYKELIEGDDIIILHKCSRKYNCTVSKASFEMLIEKCLKAIFPNIFPKIISTTSIELYVKCPCTKIDDTPCNKIFSLNKLLEKYNLFDHYKFRIMEKTKILTKNKYNIELFIKCPKPDCPNGDGFILNSKIQNILDGTNSINESPVHKCDICNTVWCSKCNKIHPGRLCPEEDDIELTPDDKKCPGCKTLIHRIIGCFHMTCPFCGVHWCWECNHFTPQSDAYAHVCVVGNWLSNT